ncbi:alpha/beta hydrolase [Tepidamorphus sp. 3E244]|uniref:alpha/beta hydrolase n=1 Tax=Tepidamorphus sp. 3E244 TaxID=3385498 RepID=UPI0038FC027C
MSEEHKAGGYTYAHEAAEPGNPLTLILLHGTGGDHTSFIGLGRLVAPGAELIALKGDVDENGNLRFFRRTGEGIYDMDDLKLRTYRVADAIDTLLEKHGRARENAIAIGYSNGANLIGNLLYAEPDRINAAVLMHPLLPYEPEGERALGNKPVLITYGRRDPIVPTDHVQEIVQRLRQRGGKVSAQLLEAGHEVREPELTAIRNWIESVRDDPDDD